jgi:hypothetical protein
MLLGRQAPFIDEHRVGWALVSWSGSPVKLKALKFGVRFWRRPYRIYFSFGLKGLPTSRLHDYLTS